MTPEKIHEVLTRYDKELGWLGYRSEQFTEEDYNHKLDDRYRAARPDGTEPRPGLKILRNHLLDHCRWMCSQALTKFFDGPTKDVDKAMRWMCYVQGVTNALGIYSCNDLRDHSRSGKEAFKTPAEEHDGDPFEVPASLANDLRLAVIECDGDNLVSLAKRFVICSANDTDTISVSDLIPRIEFDEVEATAAIEAGLDPENGFPGWDVVFAYIDRNPGLLKTTGEIEDVAAKPAEEHAKVCGRCGTDLVYGLCSEETCPFHEHGQICPLGWHNHPEKNIDGKKCECDPKKVGVGRVVIAAKELLEHIDECDEDALLALDEDPHPPSAISVLADNLNRELKKLE